MKVYTYPLYVCSCGYETTHRQNVSKHKKTSGTHEVTLESVEFVKRSEYDAKPVTTIGQQAETITNNNHTDNSTKNITINLVVPEQSIIGSIQDAIQSEECIREIRGADPQQIPAILFKYTRGTMSGKPLIKYDPKKNVVESKDPVTGEGVKQKLAKFRNDYLAKQTDIYDETFHIPYLPQPVKRDMLAMTNPQFPTGNKKDKPVSPAEVIKICATGDHRMYKLPHDTKRFYTDVAENVDTEIKSCS
ncbi:hypothetical protein ATCV1_Z747L [Acanthocystis turfacea chlorella virus 1]|uniref:Uncharacterized protein Z747L n=1 Tax=Chlorovirus heliozoae TaxID=322019 RepID=A7KA07_9PHYC|nr:hypothetical protein ATCV1_Z747L [Acanthocystis turfacea chlorella virus 1]ABT16881.1 hypothetical protein ATCV1_Z747L [Acanthocystis turfacea chlorella virus 1]AGE57111.1 protein of unknown function (DUF1390) [Acanthocystis turfacea Chlorella virus NE-JV-3]AGE59560.1 protein of unknown function (DUF1390) [Acanthocystis turfacea Chlorella virus OR0704.3]